MTIGLWVVLQSLSVDGDVSLVCGLAGVSLLPPQLIASHPVGSPPLSYASVTQAESVSSYDGEDDQLQTQENLAQ